MLSPLELEKINMLEILLSLVKTPYNEKDNCNSTISYYILLYRELYSFVVCFKNRY
jgi:hypothetical protein